MDHTITLHNGVVMPRLGLGVWKAMGKEASEAVTFALDAGYRLIDTAKIYQNEQEVGEAIRASAVPRDRIFLTTKLWNDDQGYTSGLAAMDTSLKALGTDYVDLYLIHWPFSALMSGENRRAETWKAMEEILASGKARAIGVCNYEMEHLEEMKTYAHVQPMVNQIEFHPFWYRKDLMEYCHDHSIVVENYSPLSRGTKLQDPRITAIANVYGKSNAQILIRWGLQHDNVVIPKSTHQERIRENFDVFDFELSDDDMHVLDAMNENWSVIFG